MICNRQPPRKLVKEIRDELVIRENISPNKFKKMLEHLMENRDLILDKLDIDVNVGWRFEDLDPENVIDYYKQGYEVEYNFGDYSLELGDRLRLLRWEGTRYEVIEEYSGISKAQLHMVMGPTGAIRRFLLHELNNGEIKSWIGADQLASQIEMVRQKSGHLILKNKYLSDYIFTEKLEYSNRVTIFDGIVKKLRDACISPALIDIDLYKKRIIEEENRKNRERLEEIEILAGDDEEYRNALISRLSMKKEIFVKALKVKIRELEKDQGLLDDRNRLKMIAKYLDRIHTSNLRLLMR